MDDFDSVLEQFEKFKSFDAVRIVNPSNNLTIDEKYYAFDKTHFPNFNINQTKNFFGLCTASQKPVLNIIHAHGDVFLLIVTPVNLHNHELLSEFLTKVTGNVFLNDVNFDDQLGLVNEVNRLKRETLTDELTGVYNRRFINERLPIDILTCTEQKRPLSVIFSDLDYYKKVNDVYGHTAGDHVLRAFTRVLSQNIRKDRDWIARYGGEEFIICLNGAGFKRAKEIAERIRIAVMNKLSFSWADHKPDMQLWCLHGR